MRSSVIINTDTGINASTLPFTYALSTVYITLVFLFVFGDAFSYVTWTENLDKLIFLLWSQ